MARIPVYIDGTIALNIRGLSIEKKQAGESSCSAPELFDRALARFYACEKRKMDRAKNKDSEERQAINS